MAKSHETRPGKSIVLFFSNSLKLLDIKKYKWKVNFKTVTLLN